jgi:hypothetical protein
MGFYFDAERGTGRWWYVGADGIKRWADNDRPVDEARQPGERQAQNQPEKEAE